jgi:hypothetical protein
MAAHIKDLILSLICTALQDDSYSLCFRRLLQLEAGPAAESEKSRKETYGEKGSERKHTFL